MSDRLLTPYTPSEESLHSFNKLTREAWGGHAVQEMRTHDEERRFFLLHNLDTEAYAASMAEVPIAVSARIRYIKFGRVVEILTLGVDPALRNQGIGSQAVEELIEISKEKGARVMKVTALTTARSLYERQGFRATASNSAHTYLHRSL